MTDILTDTLLQHSFTGLGHILNYKFPEALFMQFLTTDCEYKILRKIYLQQINIYLP